jgi:tRNA-dihydrouridine synthase B
MGDAASRSPVANLDRLLAAAGGGPVLALAPMQDVTDLAFWRLIAQYGGPDLYFTEYFRVHATSVPERSIRDSITGNPTGRPVIAQMIGNDIPALVRTARRLQELPVAGIDLNLGCPAPVVYRKCAGGGLLRDLDRVDAILRALRDAVSVRLSVKTRVGFDSPDNFERVIEVLARHPLDLVTVHGRTVAEMYRSPVRYELIARAADTLPCPVLANGNVYAARQALEVQRTTGVRGLMIGRGAIRNPWLFEQVRQVARGEPPRLPTGRDVRDYVRALYAATAAPGLNERSHVQRIKKYLNYVGLGIEPTGRFLEAMRRATTERELERILDEHLDHGEPMPLEPLPVPLGERDVLAGEHRS